MAIGRKFRVSSKFTGNGILVADSGDGQTDLAPDSISATEIQDAAVTTEKLESGAASPGNDKYYGTDSGGTKGFFDLPTATGSGAPSYTQLTAGDAVCDIEYTGDTAPTSFVESPVGTYTLTVPTGTVLRSGVFVGGSTTVATNQLTLKFVDTDGRSIHFVASLIRLDTYQEIGLALSGISPTQDSSVGGTVTSIWQNMNYPDFQVNLSFVNMKVPA